MGPETGRFILLLRDKVKAMLRKMLFLGGALSVLSVVSLATPLGSYARCAVAWMKTTASDSVPLEWEIKRARQMVSDLQPEIARHAKLIAREKIELAKLQRQTAQAAQWLEKSQGEVERLTADLKRGDTQYTYAGHTYTSAQVHDDLAGRFERHKTRRETLDRLQQMVAAREASVRSAGERLEAMLTAKNQLEVEIENLQARVGSLRVAQTASELNLDDSHLARTREVLDDIASRLDVEEEVALAVTPPPGVINLDTPDQGDLLDVISTYFNGESPATQLSMAPITLD